MSAFSRFSTVWMFRGLARSRESSPGLIQQRLHCREARQQLIHAPPVVGEADLVIRDAVFPRHARHRRRIAGSTPVLSLPAVQWNTTAPCVTPSMTARAACPARAASSPIIFM